MDGSAAYQQVFHDGEWTHVSRASVGVGSLALRYGLSVFEGIRLYRQRDGTTVRPFLLGEHLRRFADSLALMFLPDPGIDSVPGLIDELAQRNGVDDDAYVRVAVTPTNPGGLDTAATTALTLTVAAMGRKRWLARSEGMHLHLSAWQRADERAFPSAAKNVSAYAGARLAAIEATAAGYDGCVLSNQAGRLCEAPTAAVFVVRNDVLYTPALDEGVLPSITRRWVLSTAAVLGLPAVEGWVQRTDAYLADEAFLCGTGIEFGPVRAFDGHACRSWPHHPVTKSLVERYFAEARGSQR